MMPLLDRRSALHQLTRMRMLTFLREPEAVFWVFAFPVIMTCALGIAFRERFWELRGCMSDNAYPYGYAARLVTKKAHEMTPDDPAVTEWLTTIES